MGRPVKRDIVAGNSGGDMDGAAPPKEGGDEGRGKFPEEIESEIAEVRERMKSSRKVRSFSMGPPEDNGGVIRASTEKPCATEGSDGAGTERWIPEIVHNEAGTFRPFGERAAVKEIPDPTSPITAASHPFDPSFKVPGPVNGGGVGTERSNVRGSTFDTNNQLDSRPAHPAAGSGNGAVVSSTPDENRRKLRALAQKVKLALAQKGESPAIVDLDDGLAKFTRVSEQCRALCTALVLFEVNRRTEVHEKTKKGGLEPISHEELAKALERAPGLMEVRDWRETVAALAARLRETTSETETRMEESPGKADFIMGVGHGSNRQQYSRVEEDLSYLTALFLEGPISTNVPEPTRQGSHGIQRGSRGENIPPETVAPNGGNSTSQEPNVPRRSDTATEEIDISRRGDAVLEFSVAPGGKPDDTLSRTTPTPCKVSFRVSSHILSETSPVFAQLFSGSGRETKSRGASPRPRPGVARDGARVNVYRMSPLLAGEIWPLQILLYAAHMHSDKVPREIDFDDFVAIAKLCLRFQCTAPLELVVEMCWLQKWVHKGVEAMPDGLLLISYAFGSRGLFSRMTKSAILNIIDEADLEARPWPPEVKEKIWAVRQAKMEQIYACCVGAVQECLRPPRESVLGSNVTQGRPKSIFETEDDQREVLCTSSTPPAQSVSQSLFSSQSSASASTTPAADPSFLTSIPRCPKGSHDCDAANLGYFMIVLSELQLLPILLNPGALAQSPGSPMSTAAGSVPRRSLAQLVKILQRIPSPPNAVHRGGVCDPMPAFRNAVMDIYNSLSGITLYDVTGKHGYALSKKYEKTPQKLGDLQSAVTIHEGTLDVGESDNPGVEIPERVALGILRALDTLRDVVATAMTSRRFYDTYKRNEASLTERFGKKPQDKQAPYPSPTLEVLTEEEARRIIWPDSPVPPSGPLPRGESSGCSASSEPPALDIGEPEPEGAREKFRAEDALFTEGKVLSVIETKQLTVEHDVYLGMHRGKAEV